MINNSKDSETDESIKYLAKCISEIAASNQYQAEPIEVIEGQLLTPSEELFIEEMINEFFAD